MKNDLHNRKFERRSRRAYAVFACLVAALTLIIGIFARHTVNWLANDPIGNQPGCNRFGSDAPCTAFSC